LFLKLLEQNVISDYIPSAIKGCPLLAFDFAL